MAFGSSRIMNQIRSAARSMQGGYVGRMANSTIGRALGKGVATNFGAEWAKQTVNGVEKEVFQGMYGFKSFGAATKHFAAAWEKGGIGSVAGEIGGLGMGLGWTAWAVADVYQGYKNGGVTGAVGNLAQTAVTQAVWTGMKTLVAAPLMDGLIVAGAVGFGGYAFGEASRQLGKRVRNTELGAEIVDRFGQGATIRQRSLQAIHSSRINARQALGNEGQLMHMPMPRLR